MTPVLRKLFAVVFVGLLLLPAAAELCAALNGECKASQHACCDGPRLTSCECTDGHAAEQSEPAQRINTARSDNGAGALISERPQPPATGLLVVDRCQRAVGAGQRLSLLSTLLI